MRTGKAVGIGLLVGLAIGGVVSLVARSPFYAWIGPPTGAFYAWSRRNERLDPGGLALKVGLNLAFVIGGLVLLRMFIPRGRPT